MYAVIATGGKQEKVAEGQVIDIERLTGAEAGATVAFEPVLVVDGSSVLSSPGDLAKAKVTARVVGETKAKKIRGFTYKNKSNQSRRWGHRQKHTQIEITSIKTSSSKTGA